MILADLFTDVLVLVTGFFGALGLLWFLWNVFQGFFIGIKQFDFKTLFSRRFYVSAFGYAVVTFKFFGFILIFGLIFRELGIMAAALYLFIFFLFWFAIDSKS